MVRDDLALPITDLVTGDDLVVVWLRLLLGRLFLLVLLLLWLWLGLWLGLAALVDRRLWRRV